MASTHTTERHPDTAQQQQSYFQPLQPTFGQPVAHHVYSTGPAPVPGTGTTQQLFPYYPTEQEPPWVSKIVALIMNTKTELMGKIGEMSTTVSKLETEIKTVKSEITDRMDHMEEKLYQVTEELEAIKNDAMIQKSRSIRDNLVFHGLKENPTKDTEAVVRNFIKTKLI